MDFQPAVVEYVRDRLDIPAVCTDVPGLERHYEPGSFDLVSAFWVMEHLPSARGLVETMRRLVRPGGWLVLAVPQVDSLQAAYLGGRWVNVVEAPRHLSLPSRRGIHRLCAEAGLEEVRVLPDSSIACAGMVGLSLFPDAATAHLYGGGQAGALVKRILAAGVSLAAIPLSLAENYLLRRPASAIVFARRPPEKAVSGGKSSA